MKISVYTTVKNGIYFDYHVIQMIKHHLPLADEIVVNDGYSTDGTYEALLELGPKVRVIRQQHVIGDSSAELYRVNKDRARQECTGDWCISLDCDEFIPEWEFERLAAYLPRAAAPVVSMHYVNFYGNYKVYHADPGRVRWPALKHPIHRNLPEITFVGDGSHVQVKDHPERAPDPGEHFECHHFGYVRRAARLRQKWRIEDKILAAKPSKDYIPGAVYDLAPHDWMDPAFLDGLALHDGPYVRAVREEPDEFVRDDFKLAAYLAARPTTH